ncbi:hypothetical protein H0H87_002165 [Tephrocybe sp. NHM501043]|nr:hypothetical protein H0H87_002165 [Tephrocybe sp. NHM501043]
MKLMEFSVQNNQNNNPVIHTGLCVLSALVTFFFIDPLTEEGMEREDREFREYLTKMGYDTTLMGIRIHRASVVEEGSLDAEGEEKVDRGVKEKV